jgi:hypothetical protein
MNNRPAKLRNRTSGGILIATKLWLENSVTILPKSNDIILWLKIAGVQLKLEEDLFIGCVYIPPEGSNYYSKDCFVELENDLIAMSSSSKFVCITGDFNARTKNLTDYTNMDKYVTEYIDESLIHADPESVIRSRNSMDKVANASGYKLLEICKSCNMCIVNGRLGLYSGNFTCKDTSVVDYVIASLDLFPHIIQFKVCD